MVLGGEGNKHPHRPWTGIRMCTSGRNTQKYQRWCLVAPEGGTSPAVNIPCLPLYHYFNDSGIIIEVWRTELSFILQKTEFASHIKNGQLAISWFFFFTLSPAWPFPAQGGEMECSGFPFWILETGIAAAEQELILWAVLGCMGWPCTAGTTQSPEAGGFRWVWEASATTPAQLLPSCLTASRHLNAWEGFSTNTFSLRRIFPTFFTKKKTSYRNRWLFGDWQIICLLWEENPEQ